LTFIKEGEKIPRRSLVVGNPGKIIKKVSDEMMNWKTEGTELYQKLPEECRKYLKVVDPLRKIPKKRPLQKKVYRPLKK
jgi:phenylacetic acid degradation protein